MLIPLLASALAGYLLGALPFGWLIARRFGVNIFEHGSKNPGATNVKRVLGEIFGARGKRAGDLAFALDLLKGAAAAGWPLWVYRIKVAELTFQAGDGAKVAADHGDSQVWVYAALVGLVFALVGHSFSCWTRFKGGKGVATSAGGLLVLMTWPTLVALALWVAVFQVTRYVSLASIAASVVLPVVAWLDPRTPTSYAVLATVLGVFVIARHKANIQRLLAGTENKFAKKAASPPPGA